MRTCWELALVSQWLSDPTVFSTLLLLLSSKESEQPAASYIRMWTILKKKPFISDSHLWRIRLERCVLNRGRPTTLPFPTVVAPVKGGILRCGWGSWDPLWTWWAWWGWRTDWWWGGFLPEELRSVPVAIRQVWVSTCVMFYSIWGMKKRYCGQRVLHFWLLVEDGNERGDCHLAPLTLSRGQLVEEIQPDEELIWKERKPFTGQFLSYPKTSN